jgi:hypothetical protein
LLKRVTDEQERVAVYWLIDKKSLAAIINFLTAGKQEQNCNKYHRQDQSKLFLVNFSELKSLNNFYTGSAVAILSSVYHQLYQSLLFPLSFILRAVSSRILMEWKQQILPF